MIYMKYKIVKKTGRGSWSCSNPERSLTRRLQPEGLGGETKLFFRQFEGKIFFRRFESKTIYNDLKAKLLNS